jgi:hypothetical protein
MLAVYCHQCGAMGGCDVTSADAVNCWNMRKPVEQQQDETTARSPLAVALDKLSMAMGNPCLQAGKWETLESALVDEARRRIEEQTGDAHGT